MCPQVQITPGMDVLIAIGQPQLMEVVRIILMVQAAPANRINRSNRLLVTDKELLVSPPCNKSPRCIYSKPPTMKISPPQTALNDTKHMPPKGLSPLGIRFAL